MDVTDARGRDPWPGTRPGTASSGAQQPRSAGGQWSQSPNQSPNQTSARRKLGVCSHRCCDNPPRLPLLPTPFLCLVAPSPPRPPFLATRAGRVPPPPSLGSRTPPAAPSSRGPSAPRPPSTVAPSFHAQPAAWPVSPARGAGSQGSLRPRLRLPPRPVSPGDEGSHLLWLEVCRGCWPDLAGVQRGHLSAGGLSRPPQKYSAGAKRPALHRARLLHLVADLSFCRPCLPGDLRLSDSRTGLARGSLPTPSCLAEIQSRVNSCPPTPQRRDENSCLPVRFPLCLSSADVTSRPSSQAPQSRGRRPNSKGGSSRRPPLSHGIR